MSQRGRRNGSPTSNCLSLPSSSASAGATTGGSGTSAGNPGMGLFSRLLPMKATVPFQLKPQTQPPLQTKAVQGPAVEGSSSTHANSGNVHISGLSASEPHGTRATSVIMSPFNVVSSSAVPVTSQADFPLSSPSIAFTALSQASRTSPANTSSVTGTNSASAQTQSPLYVAASPPPDSPAPYTSVHSYGSINVQTSCTKSGSPCCSPTLHLPWPSEYLNPTTSIQFQPFSPSSTSAGVLRVKPGPLTGQRRWSNGLEQESPDRISPGFPDAERSRAPPLAILTPSGIRRSSSGHVHSDPWDMDRRLRGELQGVSPALCVMGKHDHRKEIAKLRQHLQRSKHSTRYHRDTERKAPFSGNHISIHQTQAPAPKPILLSASGGGWRLRSSVEGLNQEIQRIIVPDARERDQLPPQHVPDGRRAPPPHPQRPYSPPNLSQRCSSAASRSINTQTPQGRGVVSNHSSSSESLSPGLLTVPTDTDSLEGGRGDRSGSCPSNEELQTDCREKDLSFGSPLHKYVSSPKPNNSYMFKREPPEGCERVKVFTEETQSTVQQDPQFLRCPDRNKVNFIPNSGSAFCLVSLLKPMLHTPNAEISLKSPGLSPILTLTPFPGASISLSPLTVEQHKQGVSTFGGGKPLGTHTREPEPASGTNTTSP
ncbi:hypothetical protein UPYG_G00160240 [Umbra pygmaea]|uniref:Protein FAM117B n=1 Tax=Umbra pygmaea TaxID=75934 RepID=A0ABD0X0A3_UMBPY